jgi:GNAT superfamily N-acetyltransferase
MEVKLASSDVELLLIAPVLLELRTHFENTEDLIAQIKRQQQDGYQLAYVISDDEVLCVAGFIVAQKLAWDKHVYVDDLITSASNRSTGAGKCMIDWLKQYCKEQQCTQLHLDSGVQRFAAHKFYLREGFVISSHHFSMNLP